MRKQFALLLLVLAGLFALISPSAAQNLVQNGGFEEPVQQQYGPIPPGGAMGAWMVSSGMVYQMNNDYQGANTAYEGQQYLQLTPVPCWVQQELVTVVGQTYLVSFQMSGNVSPGYGGNADNTTLVLWTNGDTGANLYQQYHTFHQNNSFANPMWQSVSFMMTAQSTHDKIAFGGGIAQYPWIDAVSVVPYTAKGTLTGRVYDAANPSVGAAYALVKSSTGSEVEADANGVYTIELAGNSTVDLTAAHDDYYLTTVTGVQVVTDQTRTVDFPAAHLPVPVQSDIIADTFTRLDGAVLGFTEGASALPWYRGPSESAASIFENSLLLGGGVVGGVSLAGGYKPADLDMSVDVSITESVAGTNWAGIAYREQIPGSFDILNGQTDAGYLVNVYADGSVIHLWRMASLASATFSPPIDWSVPHRLRVKVTGNLHQVYLDDVKIIDKFHSEKIAGGLISCVRDTCGARFDNLTCTRYTKDAGQISGTLTDITNPSQVIANATMWLDTGQFATSNEAGAYAFTRLGGGTYGLTVTADGYYSKTYSGIALANANSSAVQDVKMVPLPAQSDVVTDDFNRPDNWDSLGTTLAPQFIPWVADTESYGSYIEGNKLRQMSGASHGASLDGSFAPADVDISARLATGGSGGWIGLGYRQQLAGTYDGFRGQDSAQAGYVAYLTDDGTQVVLWRNGVVAATTVSLTPQAEHLLRVRAVGSHHEVWVDGQKRIDAWGPYKSTGGYVGILSNMEFASADDFSVGTYTVPTCTVTGTVTATGNPSLKLAGAVVRFPDGTAETTDGAGVYSHTVNADAGFVTLTAWAAGYNVGTFGVELLPGAIVTRDIALGKKAPGRVVYDTFSRPDNIDLGTTEDRNHYSWAKPWDDGSFPSSIASGGLFLPGGSGRGITIGGFNAGDFDVAADLSTANASSEGWIGFSYRQISAGEYFNCYLFHAKVNGSWMSILANGYTHISTKEYATPIDWTVPHKVRLRVEGPHHQVWLDGVQQIDVYDWSRLAAGMFSVNRWIAEGRVDNLMMVTGGSLEPQVVADVASTKSIVDSTMVSITGPIVTAVFDGCFYIEDESRAAGIKVVSPVAVQIGDAITVQGALSTTDGERYIAAFEVSASASGKTIKPVGLSNRGFVPAAGLSNIGLLTTCWGEVTEVSADQTYCYVDDGTGVSPEAGKVGIKVLIAGAKKPVVNDYVACTGVARVSTVPVLQMRGDDDLQIVHH